MKYRPMKASPPPAGITTDLLLSAGGQLVEEKIDGVRGIIEADGKNNVTIFSRSGQKLNQQFPEIVSSFGKPDVPFILDGELQLVGQADGTLQFKDLLSRVNTLRPNGRSTRQPAWFRAFDILEWDGRALLKEPLYQRRLELERAQRHLAEVDVLELLRQGGGECLEVIAGNDRAEGLILKHEESIYRPGLRSKGWVKFKFRHTLSCIAYDYVPSANPRRTLGAVELVLLDGSRPVVVGRVGSGMTERDMQLIKAGVDTRQFVIIEVSVLGKTDDGLREPSFQGIRTDADVLDAPLDQLDAVPTL